MFKRILCPVDFSEYTKIQLEFARGLSRIHDSQVTAVCVLRLPIDVYGMQSWNAMHEAWQKLVSQNLKHYCEPDIKPISSLGINEASTIIEIAEQEKSDVILMPTHGYSGLEKILLGSVFQEILLKSHIPVLALPSKFMTKGQVQFKQPANILCAIDLHEGSGKLVHLTENLAGEFKASFNIIYSINLKTELLRLLNGDPFVEEKAGLKKKMLQEYPQAKSAAEVLVKHGLPYESILSEIQDKVDLVILGFSHKSQLHLRTTLYRVISDLDIPALCFPID